MLNGTGGGGAPFGMFRVTFLAPPGNLATPNRVESARVTPQLATSALAISVAHKASAKCRAKKAHVEAPAWPYGYHVASPAAGMG